MTELAALIPTLDDPVRMGELLSLNDQLTTLLEALPPAPRRPVLAPLRGLGLDLVLDNNAGGKGDEGKGVGGMSNGNAVIVNGDVCAIEGGEDIDTPTTPRVDKGKAKAEPPPEEPEKVLSPTFMLAESSEDEDEDGESRHFVVPEGELEEGVASPTNR